MCKGREVIKDHTGQYGGQYYYCTAALALPLILQPTMELPDMEAVADSATGAKRPIWDVPKAVVGEFVAVPVILR